MMAGGSRLLKSAKGKSLSEKITSAESKVASSAMGSESAVIFLPPFFLLFS